jgi:hypothetical protein
MAGRTALTAGSIVLLVSLALAAAALWLATRRDAVKSGTEHALIGDAMLAYPAAYARHHLAGAAGRLDRLDLAATFPDFRPAGEASSRRDADAQDQGAGAVVFLTLTPDDKSLDPADRPTRLYAPFLDDIGVTQEGGLVKRRFQADTPYDGEDLYFTPPEGRSFWARCPRERAAASRAPAEPCTTELRWNGLTVALRFAPTLLPQWERMVGGARALLDSMRR